MKRHQVSRRFVDARGDAGAPFILETRGRDYIIDADDPRWDELRRRKPETVVDRVVIIPPIAEPAPHKPGEWPWWATATAAFRKPGELGVGDTVERLAGRTGVYYQALRSALGWPCHCPERKAEWNRRFAYPP